MKSFLIRILIIGICSQLSIVASAEVRKMDMDSAPHYVKTVINKFLKKDELREITQIINKSASFDELIKMGVLTTLNQYDKLKAAKTEAEKAEALKSAFEVAFNEFIAKHKLKLTEKQKNMMLGIGVWINVGRFKEEIFQKIAESDKLSIDEKLKAIHTIEYVRAEGSKVGILPENLKKAAMNVSKEMANKSNRISVEGLWKAELFLLNSKEKADENFKNTIRKMAKKASEITPLMQKVIPPQSPPVQNQSGPGTTTSVDQ